MARIHAEAIDLVILDRWFADEDGLDLCRTLRSQVPDLPVVFLSGAAHPDDLERATEAGCSAYLAKPCDIDELARVINRLMREGRKEDPSPPV
jgi:DNA-binding response OmpR family regulator